MSLWRTLATLSRPKIFTAVMEGDLQKLKALLESDPDVVCKKDTAGWTPLHYAAHWNQKDMVDVLLANGAEVNVRATDGLEPLHIAVAQGFKDIVELLLSKNAAVNAGDERGVTPLHFAVDEGQAGMVK